MPDEVQSEEDFWYKWVYDFLLYLGYDRELISDDEMILKNAERSLKSAVRFAEGAVGTGFTLGDDERYDELVFIYGEDLFNNRGVSAKVSGATRLLVHGLEQQLRLKLQGV